ncbi:unnamed protein product, partial [Discosporangium mesarthrocarpum]
GVFSCRCSFYEIYKEQVFDLAVGAAARRVGEPLVVREDKTRGVFIEGLVEQEVSSAEEAAEILRRGQATRYTSGTAMNAESSRTHAVFTLAVDGAEKEAQGLQVAAAPTPKTPGTLTPGTDLPDGLILQRARSLGGGGARSRGGLAPSSWESEGESGGDSLAGSVVTSPAHFGSVAGDSAGCSTLGSVAGSVAGDSVAGSMAESPAGFSSRATASGYVARKGFGYGAGVGESRAESGAGGRASPG